MGWNKPSENEDGLKKPGKKQSGVFKGAMAGVVVVICAVAAWFVLAPGSEKKPQAEREKKSARTIAEQKVAKPSTEVARDEKEAATNRLEKVSRVRKGSPLDPNYVSPDPTFSNRYARFKAEQAKVPFQKLSEFEIHRVIATQPGETFLPYTLPPAFDEDFRKHMNDPIVIGEDDPEELKEAKLNMIEAKKRIRELMKEGFSPRQILEQEQEALTKAQTMRDNLMGELREIEANAKSLQEVDDFVNAANKMLDEYGAKHVRMPMSPARFRLMKAEGKLKK